MEMTVSELAKSVGCNEQRLRAMISAGTLEARKQGNLWLVDSQSYEASRRSGKSMTALNAWRLLALAGGADLGEIRTDEKYRLRKRLSALLIRDDPTIDLMLRTLLANRAKRIEYEAVDASAVEKDSRVTLSGLSDERSGLTRSNEAEGYVLASDLSAVEKHLAMFRVDRGRGNVTLHVVDDAYKNWLHSSVVLTAADLAERSDVRSRSQAAHVFGLLRATTIKQ